MTLTYQGASALAAQIALYWIAQGQRVPNLRIEQVNLKDAMPIFVVRSDMIGGQPVSADNKVRVGEAGS
jgi:hypothetical protein